MDRLHLPGPADPSRSAYKDWVHLNLFDLASQRIGIFNASLHCSPEDIRGRAIGTAIVYDPQRGWLGNIEVRRASDTGITHSSIALASIGVSLGPASQLEMAARNVEEGLELHVSAVPRRTPLQFLPSRFGSGWIGWRLHPRMSVSGTLRVGDRTSDLRAMSAYYDHNWGRWHWGEDIGWEWGSLCASDGSVTFVFSRTTNRRHDRFDGAQLTVDSNESLIVFHRTHIEIAIDFDEVLAARRLPGAMAALTLDRRMPRLPGRLRISANDGVDAVSIEFRVDSVLQLVAADPCNGDKTYLHELAGTFSWSHVSVAAKRSGAGIGVLEYVD